MGVEDSMGVGSGDATINLSLITCKICPIDKALEILGPDSIYVTENQKVFKKAQLHF